MRSAAVAISLLTLAATPAGAQSTFVGGGTSCAQYMKAARTGAVHQQASSWLIGYASGVDAGLQAAKRPVPVAALAGDRVLTYAADYCRANPASTIANAASQWLLSLPQPEPPPAPAEPPRRGWYLDLENPPALPGGRR